MGGKLISGSLLNPHFPRPFLCCTISCQIKVTSYTLLLYNTLLGLGKVWFITCLAVSWMELGHTSYSSSSLLPREKKSTSSSNSVVDTTVITSGYNLIQRQWFGISSEGYEVSMKICVGLNEEPYKTLGFHAGVATAISEMSITCSLVERFPSRPSPAACSASSIVYAGSRSCLHRRLCTLPRQCDLSALSVS